MLCYERLQLAAGRDARARLKEDNMELTAVFKKVPEGYIGWVEELPGTNVQEKTLGEAKQSLREVVRLILEVNREKAEELISGEQVVKEPLSLAQV